VSEESVTCFEIPPLASRLIPTELIELLGNPPVLITESRGAYDRLQAQLAVEWKPRNVSEWMFVRDIADISWEIRRHRQAIAGVFAVSFRKALEDIFINVLPRESRIIDIKLQEQAARLANAWFEGPAEQRKVKLELAKYGLDAEAVIAQVYIVRADKLEILHRLLSFAELRRTAVVRNFNEYRAMSPLSQNSVIAPKELAVVQDA
jgi:hypothetical protein